MDIRLEPLTDRHAHDLDVLAFNEEARKHTYVPSQQTEGFGNQWAERYREGRADGIREAFAIVDAREARFSGSPRQHGLTQKEAWLSSAIF
jgi:hypothetical protein